MTRVTSRTQLISEILYSGCFTVPWHQRYYDWNRAQVSELLDDLKGALETNKSCYFLGSIMLVKTADTMHRRINDGQQRLITLSLLIAAICRRLDRSPRDRDRETLALRALFDRPSNQTSSLENTSRYQPRIEPPKNDKSRYFQIIRGYDIGTNGLLTTAWSEIDLFVQPMKRPAVRNFFDFIMAKVEVSVLDIPSDVDANAVFEALNARGKPLDDIDLIRNRVYSYFSERDDAARRQTVHENLEKAVVVSRSARRVQEYFRCYLQCRYGHLQKTRFYRETRAHIERSAGRRNPSDYVFKLVAGLGQLDSVELFRTVTSSRPSSSLEGRLPKIQGKRGLTILLRDLQAYSVSYPIVFALLHRFVAEVDKNRRRKTGQVVGRSLKNLASFVMRTAFAATKFESSKFEAAFANCANAVFKSSNLESLDILEELKRNDELGVIDDRNFIRRMSVIELRDSKRALRYLFGINARNQVGSEVLREYKCTVEHVLPRSEVHWGDWSGFENEAKGSWVYRTGNMLVVPKGENRSSTEYNRNFAAKRLAFANSTLQMSRTVSEYDEWTPAVVEKRSKELAKKAAATWQFSGLSRGRP